MTTQETARTTALAGLRMEKKIQSEAAFGYRPQKVEDGYLWYTVASFREPVYQKTNAGSGFLQSFLDLADKPDGAVISFARKHGCMGLCGHGLPLYAHGCEKPAPRDGRLFGESIDHYRRMAKLYQTLLGLAAELKVEKWGRPEDWAILESVSQIAFPRRRGLWSQFEIFDSAGMDAGKKKDRRAYLELARSEFQSFMGYLIEVVNIRPRFSWKYDGWQLEWGTRHAGNLAAVLLLQLLPVMADVDGFAICSACHLSYIPPRRPDPTRNNYCERCGRAAAVRDAKRRQRAKEREERSNG